MKKISTLLAVVLFGCLGHIGCSNSPSDPGGPNEWTPSGNNGTGGKSSECIDDGDCASAEKPLCDGFHGCVECVLDAHCPDTSVCTDNVCAAPTVCSLDSQCTDPEKPVCSFVLGQCVGCVNDADCGESQICEEDGCLDVERCVNSLDCSPGTVCDRDAEFCVECLGDSDCAETHTCVEDKCILRCSSDKDCTRDGELCDPDGEFCVECVEDVDCPELYHCDYGRCEVDVCLSGEEECHPNGTGYDVCNEVGSGTDFVECSLGSSCTQQASEASCEEWICNPLEVVCSPDGSTLELCDASGLAFNTVGECAALGGVCENSQCVEIICEPSTLFCSGTALMQCNSSGSASSVVQACDGSTQYCDQEQGACLLHKCVPNQKSCDGEIAQTCGPLGGGFLEVTDCAAEGDVCFAGQCHDRLCEIGARECRQNQVMGCADNGSRETVLDTCTDSEHCEEGMCVANTCPPDQEDVCIGSELGTCNSQGSGLADVERDCADTGEACWDGACRAVVCEPGFRICVEGLVHDCVSNGTETRYRAGCLAGTFCQGEEGTSASCVPNLCTPNSPACDGDRATTCNDSGSGYLGGGAVCDADETCVSGGCLPVICDANLYFCDESGDVRRCGPDGTTDQVIETCHSAEHCVDGGATCVTDACENGQPVCLDGLLATCADDGSGVLDDGVPCDEGYACDTDQCLPLVCAPHEESCDSNTRRTCNPLGTGYDSQTTCSAATYCAATTPGVTECLPDLCQPGEPTCAGEVVASCDALGAPTEDLGSDCSSSAQLCDGTACVDEVVEVIGTADNSSSSCQGYLLANRYYFGKPRTLTEIEQSLNVGSGTSQLKWFVYESLDGSNFTRIFEKISTSTGTGLHTSGELEIALTSDKYYAVGVRPSASCETDYEYNMTKDYLESGGVAQGSLSRYSSSSELASTWSASTSTSIYSQRLTFE